MGPPVLEASPATALTMDCIVPDTKVFGDAVAKATTPPTHHPDYYFEDGTLVILVRQPSCFLLPASVSGLMTTS